MAGTEVELPRSWSTCRFDDVVGLVSDAGRKLKQADYLRAGPIPVVDQGETFIGGFTEDRALLYEGTLPVIVFGDHTRRVKYVDFPFAVGADGVKLLSPKPCFLPKFLFYAIQNLELPNRGYSRHLQYLRKMTLPVAPLPEQHRIVAEIEKQFTRLDVSLTALRRVHVNLKRYRAATLAAACEGRLVPTEAELARAEGREYESGEALVQRIGITTAGQSSNGVEGWITARLDAVAQIKGGLTKGQQRSATDVLRPVPYLRVANVQRGWLDLSEVKTIDATGAEIEQLRLVAGDVLFNEGGDRDKLGRGWIWQGQIEECIHQNHVFRARIRDGVLHPKLLSWYANSAGQEYFSAEGKQTTNLASINRTKLAALPVPVPPFVEQLRIVAEVERRLSLVEKLEAVVEDAQRRAAALRQSILKRAFAGKLVPQDPDDEPADVLLERIRAERVAISANSSPPKRAGRKKVRA